MNTIYWHMNTTYGGANLLPGAILHQGVNLHQGANCANKRGLSLPRKSVVRLTESLDMAIAVDFDVIKSHKANLFDDQVLSI